MSVRPPYPPRRQLVAICFADIAGFARLSGRREDDALALFESAEAAVRSALVLRSSFEERAIRAGMPAGLRIGIHLADVLKAPDGDVYGDGVNAASRIVEAAEPGEVIVSEDVWRQARRRSEFRFEARGPRSLEGIAP